MALQLKGRHRVLCGDSTNKDHVNQLMGSDKVDLCFTSPPYLSQRDYGKGKVNDWDALMDGVFSNIVEHETTQILVNLGLVHKENEWLPYWDGWIAKMRSKGWRRFGIYVWDQGPGLPGNWNGRLAPAFELIFHFNKKSIQPVKTKEKLAENIAAPHGSALRKPNGEIAEVSSPDAYLNTHKIPDAVIRVMRHKARGIECKHPAVFPVELAAEIVNTYSSENVYDPFTGSGSTLIACQASGKAFFGMEIDPAYCDLIIQRYKNFCGKEVVKC